MKIQTRLTLSFFVFSLAVLASVGVIAYAVVREALFVQARGYLSSIASVEKGRLEARLGQSVEKASSLARRPALLSALDALLRERADPAAARERLERLLREAEASSSEFRGVTVLGLDGRVLASSRPGGPPPSALPGSARRPVFREDKGDLLAEFWSPLRLDGRTSAMLVAEADMESLLDVVKDMRGLGATGESELVVLDAGDGALFFAPHRDGGGPLVRDARKARLVEALSAGGRTFRSGGRRRTLWSGDYSAAAHGAVIVRMDEAEALAPARRLAAALATGAAAWLLALVVFSALLAGSVAGPLRRLTRSALEISEGRPGRRADARGDDEIGTLGRAFNRMGQSLLEANALLERKVEERTADLRRSKDTLDKIVNSVADPIFVKDRRHRFVMLNDACCQLVGRRREEMIGMSDYDFFPKEQADVFWEKDELVFRTGAENVNEEEITDASGERHVLVTKKTRYLDPDGREFIVGVIRDVTDAKRVEAFAGRRKGDFSKLARELDRAIREDLRSKDLPPKADFR
jgi:PAS domain S-box-containing protein